MKFAAIFVLIEKFKTIQPPTPEPSKPMYKTVQYNIKATAKDNADEKAVTRLK